MNEKVFMDQYQKNFLKEEEFIAFLQEREENSAWQREKSSEIRFLAADDQKVTMFMENEENHEMQPIMEDTMEHTRLVLKVQDSFYPVRSCAVKTILDRARVSGNALNKVEKTVLAKILNYCMEVASGEALLRFCEKKISAVHGGDPSDYAVLEMPELFRKTVEYLQTNFPGYTFAGASYDHSVATALWELSNETDLLQEYRELLKKHHLPTDGLKAGLRLTTSDVGYSGANLYPLLFVGSGAKILPLGSPLKLEHKNGASLEKFDSQLNLLYAQYGKALSNLEKMMSLILLHPVNAMLGVMKRIGIPKKIAMEVAENFQQQNGETCCSAYEVYLGITEAEHILMRDEPEGAKIVKMEENIARAVHIRWKDYDLAGEMKWKKEEQKMSLDLQYEPEVVVDITGLSNEDWLEYRKSGIGGSDAGIILGVSSYKLPRDVYFEKIGRTPDMPEDENWVTLEVGKRLEDLVAEIFAKKTGFRIWKEKRMLRHPLYPYMIADIDYMYETSSGEIGILECKTGSHYVKDKWDGGAVPYTYEVQCRHYMAVRNVFASYAACLHGNTENDFIYQKIERDLDFEEDLIEQEGMFWYDYVEKQKEPPLTGDGDLMLRSLKRYQAERNQQEELLFDDVYGDVFEKILEMKNEKSALDKAGRELEGKIKTLYAQFAAMLGSGTKGKCVADGCEYLITYKPSYRTLIPKEAMERMKLNDKEMFDKYASVSESRTYQVKKVIK